MPPEKYHNIDTLSSVCQNHLTREFLTFRENFYWTIGHLLADTYLV